MKKLLTMMVATFFGCSLFATTWHVNGTSGSDSNSGTSSTAAKKTIQAAIDASSPGDRVLVSPGIYEPIITNNKLVSIVGISGAESTIIDGKGLKRCVTVVPDGVLSEDHPEFNFPTNTVLVGLTLRNGKASSKFGGCLTGGIARHCVVTGGTAESGGGAASAILESCLVSGNSARADAGGCDCCVIRNCTIVKNKANSNGAAYSTCVVENSIVYGNNGHTEEFDRTRLGWGNYLVSLWGVHRIAVCNDDPKFVDFGGDNFRLRADSPCIDSGSNSHVTSETDLMAMLVSSMGA